MWVPSNGSSIILPKGSHPQIDSSNLEINCAVGHLVTIAIMKCCGKWSLMTSRKSWVSIQKKWNYPHDILSIHLTTNIIIIPHMSKTSPKTIVDDSWSIGLTLILRNAHSGCYSTASRFISAYMDFWPLRSRLYMIKWFIVDCGEEDLPQRWVCSICFALLVCLHWARSDLCWAVRIPQLAWWSHLMFWGSEGSQL